MSTRAYVQTDFTRFDGVAIHIVRERSDGEVDLMLPAELVMQRVSREGSGVVTEPSLRLPEDMARALLDALSAHFGGSSDVQTLRKDYMAERARVDKMIDCLVTPPIVRTMPG